MKNLTKQDVLDAAQVLILANGQTTTLEIKNLLRSNDYFAKQAEVSTLVQELVDDDELEISGSNGIYRTYVSVTPLLDEDEDDDNNDTSNTSVPAVQTPVPTVSTPVTAIKHQDGNVTPAKPIPSGLTKPGDWEVSSVDSNTVLYFLGDLTRDEVRGAYAKLEKQHFQSTRSTRIK